MFKLVTVTKDETQALIDLLSMSGLDSPMVSYIQTTLDKMLGYYKTETTNKLTLPNEFFVLMREAVERPVVPADAFVRDIPAGRFLNVATHQDNLRRKFREPDVIDPNFATFTKQPDMKFMN